MRVGMWYLGSLNRMEEDVCDELRNKMIDVRSLQKVRCRGQVARMLGMKARRYVVVVWKRR